MEIRVAIFEDNKLVREGLQAVINETPGLTCCGSFPDVNRWEVSMSRCQPDVVLMDIEMPGMDGIEATKNISEKYPDVCILIQTVFMDNEKIFQSLCAGASGYILKNESPTILIEAIFDVYTGAVPLSPVVAKKMLGFFSNKNVILVAPENSVSTLSERERELLQMIVSGHSYRTIAEKAFISYETVRTHFKNIYKKLHVTSRSAAVMKAIQHGVS